MKRIYLLLLLALLGSCDDDVEKSTSKDDLTITKEFVYQTMKVSYLWDSDLPDQVDFTNSSVSIDDFIKSLRNPKDRWSYVISEKKHDDIFVSGKNLSWGIVPAKVGDAIYIYQAYKDSDVYKGGITQRGWRIKTIDGVTVTAENFYSLLGKVEGSTKSIVAQKEGEEISFDAQYREVKINTIDYAKVLEYGDQKIGYFYFTNFFQVTENEISETFKMFKEKGVTKLVVDVRNNGGGLVSISRLLCKYISGTKSKNKVFVNYNFNSKLSYFNQQVNFDDQIPVNALNLDEAYFLTTYGTASASEMTINALKNVDVKTYLFGTTTNGKAFGMFPMSSSKATTFNSENMYGPAFNSYVAQAKEFVKVEFSLSAINFQGGDYQGGFSPTVEVRDDYTIPYGNPNEPLLNEALKHMGVIPVVQSRRKITNIEMSLPERDGFENVIGGVI